jgi:hypothetical protein
LHSGQKIAGSGLAKSDQILVHLDRESIGQSPDRSSAPPSTRARFGAQCKSSSSHRVNRLSALAFWSWRTSRSPGGEA